MSNRTETNSWYIGTQQECEDYNSYVTEQENYPGPDTNMFSVLTPHPTNGTYAIVKHPNHEDQSRNMTEVLNLDETWYPEN